MFGNLKSKLGDVADLKKYASPQVLNSLTGSRQRSSQHTPGTQTPSLPRHSRQPSDASIPGTTSTSVAYSTLLEKNESSLSNKDAEKLERELEKLKSALETQQDTALQRLNAKEQEWKHKLEQEHKRTSSLEDELKFARNNEETLLKKLLAKEKETSCANENILHTQDTEEKLVNLQEDYDQLEGLGTQEVAKVKHLLLNTTSELEKAKSELDQKSSEIKSLENRLTALQGMEPRIALLSEEKMDLETQVAGLTHKLNATNSKLASVSEEYEEEVSHLKLRISVLDQRHSQGSMEEEEKTQAIAQERESYEHKLEETRQQLNNIKSSWSDKISALEAQIHNLNEKIVEDQVDFKVVEERNEALRKEVERLEAEKTCEGKRLAEQLASRDNELERLKEDLDSSKWHFDTEMSKKNAEAKELRRNLHLQEEKSHQLTEDLSSARDEIRSLSESLSKSLDKSTELESDVSGLEERCQSSTASCAALQEQLTRERATLELLNRELKTVTEKHDVLSSEKSKLSSNLDKYLDKVNHYEDAIKALEQEKESMHERVKGLENDLRESKRENEQLVGHVKDLETDFDAKVENSDLVRMLKDKLKTYEDEVIEKKQMLKVQSQRLADLKKTIQRELKINPDTTEGFADSAGGGGGNPLVSPRLLPDHQRPLGSASSFVMQLKQGSGETRHHNGDLEFDPVNLEYLKHVIIKFMTSREYEAVKLTRAVSTLLHMSPEEERLLRETLEWKMSWFGPRPNIGKGQMAKAIPPSQ